MMNCAGCGLPVRKKDEDVVTGVVFHKVCPDPVQPQPDHKGKKHAGFQAQLRVADLCKQGREQLTHIKACVEHGQLGHSDTRQYAVLLQLIAEDIVKECDEATARRKELDRG
jgi:hypothetical protein